LLRSSLKTRTPSIGGVLSNSGLALALAGLLSRLLRLLLPRILGGLLTLLIRLALAATLLRLTFVVLIHSDSPKIAEILFECASLKQRPYMEMKSRQTQGQTPLCQNKVHL
jgi:hypothetical protein